MLIDAVQLLAKHAIDHPHWFEWTTQGFGMVRCYLDPDHEWRLNIWHTGLHNGASLIHDHPWDFTSWVLAGVLQNRRYTIQDDPFGSWHQWGIITPGPGNGTISHGGIVRLTSTGSMETYRSGEMYSQKANEIHETAFRDGTVTLNRRRRVGEDKARIFWPVGTEWVNANVHDASVAEIRLAVDAAMERFDGKE